MNKTAFLTTQIWREHIIQNEEKAAEALKRSCLFYSLFMLKV